MLHKLLKRFKLMRCVSKVQITGGRERERGRIHTSYDDSLIHKIPMFQQQH